MQLDDFKKLVHAPIKQIKFVNLKCTSEYAMGTLIDTLSQSIDKVHFDSLIIHNLFESHNISGQMLTPVSLKANNLVTLQISSLHGTDMGNRVALLDMAIQIIFKSQSPQTLALVNCCVGASEGKSVLQALVDSNIATLDIINFTMDDEWFSGADEPVDLLIQIISKQSALSHL